MCAKLHAQRRNGTSTPRIVFLMKEEDPQGKLLQAHLSILNRPHCRVIRNIKREPGETSPKSTHFGRCVSAPAWMLTNRCRSIHQVPGCTRTIRLKTRPPSLRKTVHRGPSLRSRRRIRGNSAWKKKLRGRKDRSAETINSSPSTRKDTL